MVRELIGGDAAIDARDANGETPLMIACEAGHEEVATALVMAGASVLAASEIGESAMSLAIYNKRVATVRAILEASAAVATSDTAMASRVVRLRDGRGRTPLMQAAVMSDEAMVVLLLEAGAAAHEMDSGGCLVWETKPSEHLK